MPEHATNSGTPMFGENTPFEIPSCYFGPLNLRETQSCSAMDHRSGQQGLCDLRCRLWICGWYSIGGVRMPGLQTPPGEVNKQRELVVLLTGLNKNGGYNNVYNV